MGPMQLEMSQDPFGRVLQLLLYPRLTVCKHMKQIDKILVSLEIVVYYGESKIKWLTLYDLEVITNWAFAITNW